LRDECTTLSTSIFNTKGHQLIMPGQQDMKATNMESHLTLMCLERTVIQDHHFTRVKTTYLLRLFAHWRSAQMHLTCHTLIINSTTTTTSITMTGELEHPRRPSTFGFANPNTMKSVLGDSSSQCPSSREEQTPRTTYHGP
jgi:hypothetical protein